MKNKTIIYGLVDPRTNSIFYVGSTVNPESRIDNHLRRYYTSIPLRCALDELGKVGCGVGFRILDMVDTRYRDAEEYAWIIRCIDMGEPLINQRTPNRNRQKS